MATTEVQFSPEDLKAAQSAERIPEPTVVVIFGASGDLTKRKLLPALFHLEQSNLLPEEFSVVGVARRPLQGEFEKDMREGILQFGGVQEGEKKLDEFMRKVSYFAMNFDDPGGYGQIEDRCSRASTRSKAPRGTGCFIWRRRRNTLPKLSSSSAQHGMAKPQQGTVHVIIEKPFGHDLASARQLNDEVNRVFAEDQIFRIDHYLGKETVQNILVFRFANGIFEPVWNRNYVDHVQITAAEDIGIEGRGPFYEKAGALRDVIQNHVMELLSFVALEPPVSFEADAMRREKVKVWRSIQPIHLMDSVRGQYGPGKVDGKDVKGYRQEDRVDPNSSTETYAALKVGIENWRWAGVPFYLRAGKRLAKRVTEITIQFKQPPQLLFKNQSGACRELQPNLIAMRIQPDEGISLRFGAKVPSPNMEVCPVNMNFSYAEAFGKSSANGYERLLLDAMLGDATLFAHRDGVEATWSLLTPILDYWAANKPKDLPNYAAGTWGPKSADELLARDGRAWHKL